MSVEAIGGNKGSTLGKGVRFGGDCIYALSKGRSFLFFQKPFSSQFKVWQRFTTPIWRLSSSWPTLGAASNVMSNLISVANGVTGSGRGGGFPQPETSLPDRAGSRTTPNEGARFGCDWQILGCYVLPANRFLHKLAAGRKVKLSSTIARIRVLQFSLAPSFKGHCN